VRTCIHPERAAHSSRYPGSKFHTGQRRLARRSSSLRKKRPRLYINTLTFHADVAHSLEELNDNAPVSFVSYKKVASIAHNIVSRRISAASPNNLSDLLRTGRGDKIISRSSDPKRGMPAHRLICKYILSTRGIT